MASICVALDYGGTLTDPRAPVQPEIGMRPLSPAAAYVIRALHRRGVPLVLASNTHRTRRPALEQAGVADLFAGLVESCTLGHAKPAVEFYAAVVRATRGPAGRVLFVGDNVLNDVRMPLTVGMRAVYIGPLDQAPDLPREAYHLLDLAGLPELIDDLGETTCLSC